ncbi:putative hydrolase [Flavihumibacter petaseus NBRC 106054]|uniref:Putative hydrolase n=2 Tax=Flavihumibacter TaxID=1004301 RepID=A0A0E9N4U3_9BACT|nr:putative hydrolase [Flavihumibacter petaseus NBRC 106054]
MALPVQAQVNNTTLIINGKIITLDDEQPSASAMVIRNNKIVYVGSAQGAVESAGNGPLLIDAKGKTIIPGLFDSHQHVIRGGRFYNAELRWDQVGSLKEALQLLKAQAARTPKGQWVRVVGGWNEFQFKEKRLPTMQEIEAATGDVPAFVLYLYAKAWLNKAALKELKITADTPNPPGGLIERDASGHPTGMLIAEPNAFILYSTLSRLPELSFQEQLNSTRQYMRELNSLGVTGVMDAGGGFQNYPSDYRVTDSLFHSGQLTLRIPFYLFAQKRGTELQDYERWTELVTIEGVQDCQTGPDYQVSGAGENLLADAADFENFLLPRPELPVTLEKNLEVILERLVKNKWPFRIHATYNESISRDLAVLEKVNARTPIQGLPWFFDHAETISEENINRIKKLGGGIAIQNRMAYQGELFVRRYGRSAAENSPPVNKILAAGIPVGLGTDGTRVSSYNPWMSIYWIVTGKTAGKTAMLSAANQVDRVRALKLFSSGGYQLIREDHAKGKLREGYLADVVILDRDYLAIDEDSIPFIRAALTIMDGKIVYGNEYFSNLAPKPVPVIPVWSPVNFFRSQIR